MLLSADRLVKARVPWYGNWKDTLMELKESLLCISIFCGSLSFPDCSHSAPCLLSLVYSTTTFFVFVPTNMFDFSKTEAVW